LIAACPPLDRNSRYCNLVQCEHFAEQCVVAQAAGRTIGWVSGHRPPTDPGALFIWQVAVAPGGRGKRLASRMIDDLLARPAQLDVTHLVTTITEDNAASWRLFGGLARDWNATLERRPLFERETHFDGENATEHLVRIAPIHRPTLFNQRG